MLCFCSILYQPYWLSLSHGAPPVILKKCRCQPLFGAPHEIFKVTPEQDLKIFRGLYPRIGSFFF